MAYTLDTNAIVYYLKDDPAAVLVLRGIFLEDAPVYVSAITEVELFAFSNLTVQEHALIEDVLSTISVVPVDSRIARIAALIRREHRVKVPDSIIAATAVFTGSTHVTRNTRDFRKIAGLSLRRV